MIKRIAAFIMAAAVLCFGCIGVYATNESNLSAYIATHYGQGRISDLISITSDTQVSIDDNITLYSVVYGDFQPDTTYQVSLILKTDDNTSVKNYVNYPFIYTNSLITDTAIKNSYNTYPNDLFQIPSSNVSGTSYALYATSYYINLMFTINTNDLPLFDGNEYIYVGFKSSYSSAVTVKLAGYTISSIDDDNNQIFNEINNNLTNINNNVQSVINNQNNVSNQITQIANNTNDIKTITNTISNQVSNVINNIQNTNNKLDTVNNNISTSNNLLTTIIEYGENNPTPNEQESAKLKQTEKDLSDAEQTLEDKSKSLTQRASTGLTNSITASGQFISSVTPAVASVTSQITNAYQSLPQDVQPMILSMPLLSFAVWLIGFKR